MAGIAGVLYADSADKDTLGDRMLDTVAHRGPDSREVHKDGRFSGGVGAQDLGIERGNGFARSGKTVLFFDGEIYNERTESKSDAEVALELYLEHGKVFPGYLEGVFACAVWNGSELVLARGPVGVRPLFYGKTGNGTYVFASEMKALVGVAEEVWELNPQTVFSSESGVNGYVVRYPEVEMPSTPEAAAKKLREILFRSVEKRMADGALGGMLLSGGLDSSIIAAIANEIKPGIPAYTVGLKDGNAPDLENAALMAGHLGVEHKVYHFTATEIAEMVPDAVWKLESFDEDCISGAISNLNASALAAKDTNCIFSGEGGDELFGGYHLLKNLPTEYERLKMMHKLVEIAYNTAVQRLDRGMMGNSLNYRTPFIDSEVIAFALQVPVRWKIHRNEEGELIEKWILREAFRDLLPDTIYKRVKLRFSAGTGTDTVMDEIAEGKGYKEKFNENTRTTPGGYYLNSPKELWYYEIFKEKFPSLQFEKLVGRWDPNK
jgi:asparagine synthase (glutamine-hydrolysing)